MTSKLEEALRLLEATEWDFDRELWDEFLKRHGCQPHHAIEEAAKDMAALAKAHQEIYENVTFKHGDGLAKFFESEAHILDFASIAANTAAKWGG